jgi:hypothetical protein
MKPGRDVGGSSVAAGGGTNLEDQGGEGTSKNLNRVNMHEEIKDWAVEVYKGPPKGKEQPEVPEEDFEIEFDEEEALESKVLGIAVFYSQKSYNPQILFSDMINEWGIQRLAAVEKLGDYMFKIEFAREEEKKPSTGWRPWRHKGNAVLVATMMA